MFQDPGLKGQHSCMIFHGEWWQEDSNPKDWRVSLLSGMRYSPCSSSTSFPLVLCTPHNERQRHLFSAHWFSVSATSLLKAADCWPPTLEQFRLWNWDPARSTSRKKRNFHSALAIDKTDQILWPPLQTLPKAHCHHLIAADALEGTGVSTSHPRAPGWADFWSYWPWTYSDFVGLWNCLRAPRLLESPALKDTSASSLIFSITISF